MLIRKRLAVLCAAVLCLWACTAQAGMLVKDGLLVSLEAQAKEEIIELRLDVQNTGSEPAVLEALFLTLPENVSLAEENADFEEQTLAGAERWRTVLRLRANGAQAPAVPETGDPFQPVPAAAALAGSVLALLVLKSGRRRQMLALLAALSLLGGGWASAQSSVGQLTVYESVDVMGKPEKVSVTMAYTLHGAVAAPLGEPAGLAQELTEAGTVRLKWKPVARADGYEVFWRASSDQIYQRYALTAGTSLQLDALPAEAVSAEVRIRAFRNTDTGVLYGAFSEAVTVDPVSVRALYIVEEEFPYAGAIYTYDTDTARLERMFAKASPYGRPVISTFSYRSQSKAQILNHIAAMGELADENDVTIFSFSTHGDSTITTGSGAGMLYLSDGSRMTFGELAEALGRIPGRLVILMDSCGSGSAIGKDTQSAAALISAAFAAADREANGSKVGEFCHNKFYVITASRGGSDSYFNEELGSRLLIWMEEGISRGDADGNRIVTLAEMAAWLEQTGNDTPIETPKGTVYMHPQVYPENSSFPLFVWR